MKWFRFVVAAGLLVGVMGCGGADKSMTPPKDSAPPPTEGPQQAPSTDSGITPD